MKRIAPTILGTLLAASVTTALGAPQGQMEVYVKRSKIEVIDIGAPGPSVGDISITTGPISKTNGGEPIGNYVTRRITMVVNQPGKTEADVMQELRLPEGTIASQCDTRTDQSWVKYLILAKQKYRHINLVRITH